MALTLRHIALAYGSRTLLSDVTAELHRGTLTALLGRNGTGKSTLLRTVAGLAAPAAGAIQRAALVSFVTTDKVRIARLTCEEVVALGRAPYTDWIGRLRADDRAVVARALEAVGMSGFARKTMDAMSDGECQRILIARALAQDTPVLLLDEPTAFLDLPNRYELCTLLRRLAHEQRKCILFSTHELDIALSLCDAIALIDTPRLHLLPTAEMVRSGHLERLFAGEQVAFDPAAGCVRAIKK